MHAGGDMCNGKCVGALTELLPEEAECQGESGPDQISRR
jgi:hypothetical protein